MGWNSADKDSVSDTPNPLVYNADTVSCFSLGHGQKLARLLQLWYSRETSRSVREAKDSCRQPFFCRGSYKYGVPWVCPWCILHWINGRWRLQNACFGVVWRVRFVHSITGEENPFSVPPLISPNVKRVLANTTCWLFCEKSRKSKDFEMNDQSIRCCV